MNAYRGELLEPKTLASQADVPVITALKMKIDIWRVQCGDAKSGLMFPNENGAPLDPSNLDRSISHSTQAGEDFVAAIPRIPPRDCDEYADFSTRSKTRMARRNGCG
jgi:hypothetical protein